MKRRVQMKYRIPVPTRLVAVRDFCLLLSTIPLFHRFAVSKGAVVSVVRQISGKSPESPDARRALTDCSIYLLAGYPRLRIAVPPERKFPSGRTENAR
jgi:hypothetical protein